MRSYSHLQVTIGLQAHQEGDDWRLAKSSPKVTIVSKSLSRREGRGENAVHITQPSQNSTYKWRLCPEQLEKDTPDDAPSPRSVQQTSVFTHMFPYIEACTCFARKTVSGALLVCVSTNMMWIWVTIMELVSNTGKNSFLNGTALVQPWWAGS